MHGIIFAALTPLMAIRVPELAEIIEQAEGAARVTVVTVAHVPHTAVEGIALEVMVTEGLWGDPPPTLTVWSPVSACDGAYKAEELIIGYRTPTPPQREYLGLPEGVLVACGSTVYREGLCDALRRLKNASDATALLDLLEEDGAAVRHQAFRQLTQSYLAAGDAPLLGHLLPLAERESDPELLRAYLTTFGHFKYEEAGPVVTDLLLRTESAVVSAGAEQTFHRVARPETVDRLVRAYKTAHLPMKGRILRALAPIRRPEAERLLAAAIAERQTIIPALNALLSAGRPVPPTVADVRDPLQARQVRALLNRLGARNALPASPGGEE
jgi:hypothetical protein